MPEKGTGKSKKDIKHLPLPGVPGCRKKGHKTNRSVACICNPKNKNYDPNVPLSKLDPIICPVAAVQTQTVGPTDPVIQPEEAELQLALPEEEPTSRQDEIIAVDLDETDAMDQIVLDDDDDQSDGLDLKQDVLGSSFCETDSDEEVVTSFSSGTL